MSGRHEFAFYAPEIVDLYKGHMPNEDLMCTGTPLVHRICQVLRLQVGDSLILFGSDSYIQGIIKATARSSCCIEPRIIQSIVPLSPSLHLCIAVLERAAFATAVEYATVLGVSAIYPVITTKSKRKIIDTHEQDRLRRIIIAAAEQSKQFSVPFLAPVMPIAQYRATGKLLVGDVTGTALSVIVCSGTNKNTPLSLCIGPEGGLTERDFADLQDEYETALLASTTLRSELAVAVGLGTIRGMLL